MQRAQTKFGKYQNLGTFSFVIIHTNTTKQNHNVTIPSKTDHNLQIFTFKIKVKKSAEFHDGPTRLPGAVVRIQKNVS